MNAFQYELRTKVFFGKGAALTSLPSELSRVGKRVMLAYGSGLLKRNGIYDEIRSILIESWQRGSRFFWNYAKPYIY